MNQKENAACGSRAAVCGLRLVKKVKTGLMWAGAILVATVCGSGCVGTPHKPALSVLECRVRLLEPYVGELAPDLVEAVIAGQPERLVKSLDELGVSLDEIHELSKAWRACNPNARTPEPVSAGRTPQAASPEPH